MACEYASQGAVLGVGEADLAPPSPTLLLTKQAHRRFQQWVRDGTLMHVLAALAEYLRERGALDLSECVIDGTFVEAKKGGGDVGKTKRGKGTKLMAVADGSSLPIAVSLASASPHEVTLVEQTLEARFVEEKPKRLIGDRAYDSDLLDAELGLQSIEMIAPHRRRRLKPK